MSIHVTTNLITACACDKIHSFFLWQTEEHRLNGKKTAPALLFREVILGSAKWLLVVPPIFLLSPMPRQIPFRKQSMSFLAVDAISRSKDEYIYSMGPSFRPQKT